MNWAVCCLIWESRGYNYKLVSAMLREKFPGREGLSVSSLQRYVSDRDEAPADIVTAVRELSVDPLHKEDAEIVSLGLEALERGPIVDPDALAASLQARLPALNPDVIGAAVTAHITSSGELVKKFAEVVARTPEPTQQANPQETEGAGRAAPPSLALRERRIARYVARQLGRLSAKLVSVAGASGGISGAATTCAILLVIAHCQTGSGAAASPAAPVATNGASGGAMGAYVPSSLLRILGVTEFGEKAPAEQYIPDSPLPNQKVPPCNTEAAEDSIGGGCWQRVDAKPPCGRQLFRSRTAEKCYRPIAADPQKPVGVTPRERDKDAH